MDEKLQHALGDAARAARLRLGLTQVLPSTLDDAEASKMKRVG
jgi:hypothetical protein